MPSKKATEPEPFDKRTVDFTKFKADLTVKDYRKLFDPKGGVIFPFFSIEILSPTKTIGKARVSRSSGHTSMRWRHGSAKMTRRPPSGGAPKRTAGPTCANSKSGLAGSPKTLHGAARRHPIA